MVKKSFIFLQILDSEKKFQNLLKSAGETFLGGLRGAKIFSVAFRIVFRVISCVFQTVFRIDLKVFRGQFRFFWDPSLRSENTNPPAPKIPVNY